jgi:hypothetical protein
MALQARTRVIARLAPALRRWQTWVVVFLWVAVAYVSYLLVTGLLTPAAPITSADNAMVMRGITAQGEHGRSGWKFEADSSEISEDGFTTTYRGVHNATYFRDGRPAYRLAAGVVTVDSRNQNYSATGGVHVRSTSPTLPEDLQTDSAYWQQSEQMLTCSTPTRFIYHGTTLHTTNMTVNMQTGAAQLGNTTIDYEKGPASPTPSVSAGPITTSPAPSSTNR